MQSSGYLLRARYLLQVVWGRVVPKVSYAFCNVFEFCDLVSLRVAVLMKFVLTPQNRRTCKHSALCVPLFLFAQMDQN